MNLLGIQIGKEKKYRYIHTTTKVDVGSVIVELIMTSGEKHRIKVEGDESYFKTPENIVDYLMFQDYKYVPHIYKTVHGDTVILKYVESYKIVSKTPKLIDKVSTREEVYYV